MTRPAHDLAADVRNAFPADRLNYTARKALDALVAQVDTLTREKEWWTAVNAELLPYQERAVAAEAALTRERAQWPTASNVQVGFCLREKRCLELLQAEARAKAAEAALADREELLARILDYGAAGYAEHQARRRAWESRAAGDTEGAA